jgi:hypothetical protein
MAFCESCNSEVRDDAWVCGHCGAPMKTEQKAIAASDTTNPYVFSAQAQAEPAYQTPQPSSVRAPARPAAAASDKIMGLSRLTFTVVVAAIVVVAGLALWYVFFSNGDGGKYVGTWTPVNSVSAASQGIVGDNGRLVVARSGGDFTVTAIDAKGQSIGPLKASVKRGKLEFGLEYAGSDQEGKLKLQLVKAFMGMLVKDFRATLSDGPGSTIFLSYSGKATNDLLKSETNAVQLRRVSAQ